MATKVQLLHPGTGIRKTGYFGFSWTSFFFGGIPAMMRGDIGIGIGVIVAGIVALFLGFGFGWFVVGTIWAFVYNKSYTTKLIENGYRLADTPSRNAEAQSALGFGDQSVIGSDTRLQATISPNP